MIKNWHQDYTVFIQNEKILIYQDFSLFKAIFVTKKLRLFVETRFSLLAMSGMSLLTFDAVSPLKIEKYFSIL